MAFISPQEALERKSTGWIHIDVRDPHEFAELRATNSINIPFVGDGSSFLSSMIREYSREDKIIISSDVHSFRCARAATTLASRGFDEIARIHGGHEAWIEDTDLPTESDE